MSGKSRVFSAAFSAAPLLDTRAFGTRPYILKLAGVFSGGMACNNAASVGER